MDTGVLFKETQRFRQWWLLMLLFFMNCISFLPLIKKYTYRQPFTDTAYHSYSGAEVVTLITLLITGFFLILKLETIIKTDEIEVRLFPFHSTFKQYSSTNIELIYVRKYDSLSEFGGWGLRIDLFGKGEALNIYGNQGIQLVFKDGSKLLIGTQKPDEAAEALRNFLPKKE